MNVKIIKITAAVRPLCCFLLLVSCGCRTTSPGAKQGDTTAEVETLALQTQQIVAPASDIIRPGDELTIQVWMADRKTQFEGFPIRQEIADAGDVFIPSAGLIRVSGKKDAELEAMLREHFSKILKDPTVVVQHKPKASSISQEDWVQRAQHIAVLGCVQKPGLYEFVPGMTVRDAVARAGWLGTYANRRNVFLVRGQRGDPEVVKVNLKKIETGAGLARNVELASNDAIYVPTTRLWATTDFIRTLLIPIAAIRDAVWVYDRTSE